MAKNAIIAVLFLSVVGLLGYILERDIEQAPLTPEAEPRESAGSAITNRKTIIGDHTISYQSFDPPLLAWVSSNAAEVELTGMALNKLDENQNELLLLFKIELKHGGYCSATIKQVFRRVLNDEGDLSAPTSTAKGCGVPYTTLSDQWIAFAVEPKLRDFHLWLPPTSPSEGITPTGDMYVSVVDSETIEVRIE